MGKVINIHKFTDNESLGIKDLINDFEKNEIKSYVICWETKDNFKHHSKTTLKEYAFLSKMIDYYFTKEFLYDELEADGAI